MGVPPKIGRLTIYGYAVIFVRLQFENHWILQLITLFLHVPFFFPDFMMQSYWRKLNSQFIMFCYVNSVYGNIL